ncbi:MAG: hypothetical protein J3Q66DRAFT_440711 [Benniella sp.]|nr:MAG: hypothetical protein J3Q66DRAFT_440711 [Benniella sp.]
MARTAIVPIPVTDEDDLFIDQWKRGLTGQDTFDLEKRTAFNEEEALCFLPDPIQDAEAIHALDIFHLDSIPSRAAVMKAGDMLQNAHVDPVNKNKDLTKHDKDWEAFRDVLRNTSCILDYTFKPYHTVTPDIKHLFSFIGERWLTGEAIDVTMDMLSVHEEGFLFLPTHISSQWGQTGYDYVWTFRKREIQRLMERSPTEPAGEGIRGGEHWQSLGCVVYRPSQKSILFGDSLDDGKRPRLGSQRLGYVVRWLSSCGVDIKSWNITENKIQRFDVLLPPRGKSVSCGVIALNSIERGINPSVECWSHETSAYHRLRYLALLTRPFEELHIEDTQDKMFMKSLETTFYSS